MKTSKRFTEAVIKLYTAFHGGSLNPIYCNACAVGNIIESGKWFLNDPETLLLSPTASIDCKNNSGYSFTELANIERAFLGSWNYITRRSNEHPHFNSKKIQFKGLCAVVEYLCELEGISNVMDYTKLFDYNENNEPVNTI